MRDVGTAAPETQPSIRPHFDHLAIRHSPRSLGRARLHNRGYPSAISSERPSYQLGISVLDHDNSGDAMQLEHQGDSTKGDSGGPFFGFWPDGYPYVVGTVSGGEQLFGRGAEDNNICAGGKAVVDLIKWGLANWK